MELDREMTEQEVIEKVARAICKGAGKNPDQVLRYKVILWTTYKSEAKAAIQSLKSLGYVRKQIIKAEKLDPIALILEDLGKGQGSITISCYGEAWSNYWGSMGERTIADFIIRADVDYIANKLFRGDIHLTDYDAISEKIGVSVDVSNLLFESEKVEEHYGECWHLDLPTKTNPAYLYLTRIIEAIQSFLKQQAELSEKKGND